MASGRMSRGGHTISSRRWQPWKALIDYLDDRRSAFPGMHVYHYNHTERSSLERLAATHGVGEVTCARWWRPGGSSTCSPSHETRMQVGTESYGLKSLERLAGYQRGHEIERAPVPW